MGKEPKSQLRRASSGFSRKEGLFLFSSCLAVFRTFLLMMMAGNGNGGGFVPSGVGSVWIDDGLKGGKRSGELPSSADD